MTGIPAELAVLRASQDRALHREGIPMLVALVDERPAPFPHAPGSDRDPDVFADLEVEPEGDSLALADRLQHYRGVLAAHQRDDDMGVVISVLAAVAYEDFDHSAPA